MFYRLQLIAVMLAVCAKAGPVVVPPYSFSGFAATSYIGVFPNYVTTLVNFSGPIPPNNTIGGAGETAAALSYSSAVTPQPQLSATASALSDNVLEGASANLLMELTYYLVASGPGPLVTVDVSGFGHSTFPGEAAINVLAPELFAPIHVSSPLTTNWIWNDSFTAATGYAYQVNVEIQISLGSGGDGLLTQTAFVDPIFTIDAGFPDADLYRLDFSPGIGNGEAVGSVPEPSTLPVIALLPFFSAYALRRKRLPGRNRPGSK